LADDRAATDLRDAMCRAVDDTTWLDACLAKLDRSMLDD
jgi:hypothetical protein